MKIFSRFTLTAVLLFAFSATLATAQTNSTATNNAATPVKQPLPRLLDLGANKCIPCKAMAPILEEMKKEYAGKLEVEFIDVWKDPDAGKPYKIQIIPTQIFFDATGKELFRHIGFYSKDDILSKWTEFGVDLKQSK
jgi:thioredoxin 1